MKLRYLFESEPEIIDDEGDVSFYDIPVEVADNRRMRQLLDTADIFQCYLYARDVIKGRWPELEKKILERLDGTEGKVDLAVRYAEHIINGRWPELEKYLLSTSHSGYVFQYALYVIRGRWLDGEDIIKKDGYTAWQYACRVINGRWPEAEEEIRKDPAAIYHYALYVINGRWPEAELDLVKDRLAWLDSYAMDVLRLNYDQMLDFRHKLIKDAGYNNMTDFLKKTYKPIGK